MTEEKLKTLNDIVMLKTTRFMIRQEAIKWVKSWGDDYMRAFAMIEFQNFFNITEEDLKDD